MQHVAYIFVLILLILQRQRLEELEQQAKELAEQRRAAREQALEWTMNAKGEFSDDEKEKRVKRGPRKDKKVDGGSGDETTEPKKRRRGKGKKGGDEEHAEEQALFSDQEEGDKPAKKVPIIFFDAYSY